jgi:hypothetical protein
MVKSKRQADAALGPDTVDAAVIQREFPPVGSANRRDVELDGERFQSHRGDLDAVNGLIEAIDGGGERTVRRFGYMQDKVKNGFAGLERPGPVAFEPRGGNVRLWLVGERCLAVCGKREMKREVQEKDGEDKAPLCGLQQEPPEKYFKIDDDVTKRVGMRKPLSGKR